MTRQNRRIKVRAIRAANGRIQTWAVEQGNWEISTHPHHTDAMHLAQWWAAYQAYLARKAKQHNGSETP